MIIWGSDLEVHVLKNKISLGGKIMKLHDSRIVTNQELSLIFVVIVGRCIYLLFYNIYIIFSFNN